MGGRGTAASGGGTSESSQVEVGLVVMSTIRGLLLINMGILKGFREQGAVWIGTR